MYCMNYRISRNNDVTCVPTRGRAIWVGTCFFPGHETNLRLRQTSYIVNGFIYDDNFDLCTLRRVKNEICRVSGVGYTFYFKSYLCEHYVKLAY